MGQGLDSLVRRLSRGIATLAAPLMLSSCATFYFGQQLPPDDLYDIGKRVQIKAPEQRDRFSQDTLVLGQEAFFDAIPQEQRRETTVVDFDFYSPSYSRFFFTPSWQWNRDFDFDGIFDWADPWPHQYGPYVDTDGNHVPSFMDWEVGGPFSNFYAYGYNSWNRYGGMWGYNSWSDPFWHDDFWWGHNNRWGHDFWWDNHMPNYWYGGNGGGSWSSPLPAYGRRERPSNLTTTTPSRRVPTGTQETNTTQPTRRVPATTGSQLRTTDPSSRREYVPPTNNRTESKTGTQEQPTRRTQTNTATDRTYTPSYNQLPASQRPLYNNSNTTRSQFENRRTESNSSTTRQYVQPNNQGGVQRRSETPSVIYQQPSNQSRNSSGSSNYSVPSRSSSSSIGGSSDYRSNSSGSSGFGSSSSSGSRRESSSSSSGGSYESRSSSSGSSGASSSGAGSSGSSSSSSSGRRR